uniref:Uncharacterized protein n=1 Tax=Yersinia enterocolitica W22703 TaxID=913028 RepID=F4MWV0_YEREN|nr:unknown protein [Yersinia enterocolitica W22703]
MKPANNSPNAFIASDFNCIINNIADSRVRAAGNNYDPRRAGINYRTVIYDKIVNFMTATIDSFSNRMQPFKIITAYYLT